MPTHFSSLAVNGVPVGGPALFSSKSKSIYVDPVNGIDGNDGLTPQSAVKTIARGYALLTANQNDTLYLIGTTAFAPLAATLVWAKDYTHFVGIAAPTAFNCRARINHSANFSPGIQITGNGCMFKNLYFSYGRGNAGNLIGVEVTGDYNYFENVHFAGPMHATEAGTAGFMTLKLTGATENTFKNCTIGITTIARSAANSLILMASSSGRTLFEDCEILSMSSAATPLMVKNSAVDGIVDFVQFKNCQFLNFSANWGSALTAAIANADGNSGAIILQNCMLTGITDVGAAGNRARTFVLGAEGANTDKQALAIVTT